MPIGINPPCVCCQSSETKLWSVAKDVEYYSTEEIFSYYLCSSCRVLFIDPVPNEKLPQIYPTCYYSFSKRKATIVERIKEWIDKRFFTRLLSQLENKRLSVLDIGGGNGWLLSIIRKLDSRVLSTQIVDIDSNAQREAEDAGHNFFCGRIEDFSFNSQYDLIVALNLIEHVEDPLAVLKKIRGALHPEGVALIKTPNYDSLDARIFRNHNWGGLHCPRHWVLFTRESFTLMAAQAGFRLREFSYTQGAPFWAVSMLHLLEKIGVISIDTTQPLYQHRLFGLVSAFAAAFDIGRKPVSKLSQMFFVFEHEDLLGAN